MERKKVLYVVTKSAWGGAQRYVYDLAIHLPRDRFEPIVAAGGRGPLFDKLKKAGIKTIAMPEFERDIHIIKEVRALLRLYRIFKSEKPDIIHLNSSKAGGLGALAAFLYKTLYPKAYILKPKIVFTVHGWPFREERPFWERWLIFIASYISALLSDKVILITKSDFQIAQKIIRRRKLAFIPNGIEYQEFLSREEARAFLAEKLGRPLTKEAVILGTVAELTKNKGISYLISALSRLNLNNYYRGKASIVVIGEGEERGKLEKQIESLKLQNNVRLAGFVPEAHRYMAAFDIFVLPSVKEGLPYTVMEAMAAGIPVAASAVGGIPDLIQHGVNGLLAAPKVPENIAGLLDELLKNTSMRTELGEAGKKIVEANFRLRDMITKTVSIYE